VDYLTAIAGAQTAAIVALAISLVRTREKVTRLEEWVRLREKQLNGNAGKG